MTVASFLKGEAKAYRALWLWISGRRFAIESDSVTITSTRGSMVMPVAFAVATIIEIIVLHLLLPWVWLQVTVAAISVWSLIVLFGHLAKHRTNPHYLTDSSLVLRQSGSVVCVIDRAEIVRVAPRRTFSETSPTIIDGRLYLPNADGTNVDIVLETAVRAALPVFVRSHRTTEDVTRISLYVDEPARLISLSSEEPVIERP